jgi:hypothetical protein
MEMGYERPPPIFSGGARRMKSRMATSKELKRQRTKPARPAMVTVQNVNVPGYTSRVEEAKYTVMRRALLQVLPTRDPGITQAEMFEAVVRHLPENLFPGGSKAGWWAKTVQLDLEAKGIVGRAADAKPLRWYRLE